MKLKTALHLGRISNLPTVWTNGLTAMVICRIELSFSLVAMVLSALSLFYIGGMFLNDAFDRRIDAVERPERPIPSGTASASEVFVVGFLMLAVGIVFLSTVGFVEKTGIQGPLAGLALAVSIVFYDIWHKGNRFSPVIMGLCRAGVYLSVGMAVVGSVPLDLLFASLTLWGYVIGLTYIARQETLAKIENWWPLLFLVAPIVVVPVAESLSLLSLFFAGLLYAVVAYAVRLMLKPGKGLISAGVASLIAGIALLDGLYISLYSDSLLALTAFFCFLLTLLMQKYVAGT